jgi:hypothetical protein
MLNHHIVTQLNGERNSGLRNNSYLTYEELDANIQYYTDDKIE